MRLSAALALSFLAAAATAQSYPTSRQGLRGWVQSEFARADRNRDGQLDRGEVTQAVNRHYGRQGISTGRSRILTNMWFNRLDGDKSNAVSRREAEGAFQSFFARFDRNRDGRLQPRERAQAESFLRNPAR